MTTEYYIKKAEGLLEKLENIGDPKSFTDDGGYGDVEDEFVHLVFFFNPDMPLYKEITSKSPDSFGILNKQTLPKYIKRFIHYLNEFCLK